MPSLPTRDDLERVKLGLELVTRLAIIVVFGLAIIFAPSMFVRLHGFIEKAGYSVAGIEWFGIKLERVTEDLAQARATVTELNSLNTTITGLLECKTSGSCTPDQERGIPDIIAKAKSASAAANVTVSQIDGAINATEQQVEDISTVKSNPVVTDQQWIAVAGADRVLPEAKNELNKLISEFPESKILRVDGWFRTVVVFPDKATAQANVKKIKNLTGRDPYLRSYDLWCPVRSPDSKGFIACSK